MIRDVTNIPKIWLTEYFALTYSAKTKWKIYPNNAHGVLGDIYTLQPSKTKPSKTRDDEVMCRGGGVIRGNERI